MREKRWLLCFLVAMCCTFSAWALPSQDKTVTLKLHNVSIETVLDAVKKQTGVNMLYNSQMFKGVPSVSLDVKNERWDTTLKLVLNPQGFDYVMKDGIVVIRKQKRENRVRGMVTDSHGEPIPGASIIVKGTRTGTSTNIEGEFTLDVKSDKVVLEVSFIGMKKQTVQVDATRRKTVEITLVDDVKTLEDVVVTGYSNVRKSSFTGSSTQISGDDLRKVSQTNIIGAIQSFDPSFRLVDNVQFGSDPNALPEMYIRGRSGFGVKELDKDQLSKSNLENNPNLPTFIMDGFEVSIEKVYDLDPTRIESLTVLKDAAATAMYGSRAANGVVVINTKRGKVDEKPTISFKTEQSFQQEGNLKIDYLNAAQWLEIATEAYKNGGKDVPWGDSDLEKIKGNDNCWPDLMKRTGYLTNNNLSITGGSKNSNYFVSLNYLYNEGIIKEQSYNRLNLRLNSDHKIGDRIKFGHSVNLYASEQTSQRDFDWRDTYAASFRYSPLNAMYDKDGDFATISNTYLQSKTPSPLWMLKNSDRTVRNKGIDGNLYLAVDILEGLKFTARVSGEWKNGYSNDFIGAMDTKYGMEGSNVNKVTKTNAETFHWITDYTLDYQKTFNQIHSVSALLGYSVEKQTFEDLMGSRGNTPSNDIKFLNAGDPSTALNSNSWSEWSFLSQFGRLAYSFKDKYYFSGTLRRDGSSRLVKDKYGIFPSVSAAWRIGEEKFMDAFNWLDELKFRLSWGKVGNVLSINPYGTSVYLSQQNAVFNEKVVAGYTFANAVNTDLKWESTEKKNIGLDLSMFGNSFYVVMDFYIEDTKDLLFNQPIATSVGLSGSPYINAGHIRNTGIDFEIGYRRTIGDWKFDVNFNASHVHNEVIDLEGRDLTTSGIKEGYPIGSFYGYVSNGIIRTQDDLNNHPHYAGKQIGDIWFKDINGYDENGNLTGKPDGKVDTADRALFGKVFPDLNYGLAGSVSYKNLTLQIQLQGVQGIQKNMLSGGYATDMFGGEPNMEASYILDRYDAERNPNGKYPRVAVGDPGQNQQFSDFWLIDASYLSIRNLNLSYSFPKNICNKLGMENLNAYIGVQNLYTFGNEYSEISSTVTVPMPRTCTFGLQFAF